MSIDSSILAHLGDSSVVAVDTNRKSVRGQVSRVSQVHGVLAVPELGRIYATATGTNELVVIDTQNVAVVARDKPAVTELLIETPGQLDS